MKGWRDGYEESRGRRCARDEHWLHLASLEPSYAGSVWMLISLNYLIWGSLMLMGGWVCSHFSLKF